METANQQMKKPKKPPRETRGTCTCPFCSTEQPVRKNIKGKLYINCTRCGVIQPALPYFQEWILENAKLYGPDGEPPTPAAPAKSPEPDTRDAPRTEPVELPAAAELAPPAAPVKASTPKKQEKSGFGMFRHG